MPLRPLSSGTARKTYARRSLRTALFFQTFGLLLLTIGAATAVAFSLSWNELKARTISELQSTAFSRENFFETTISRQREQLSILARNGTLAALPSVTNIVGFKQLLDISPNGTVTMIAGEKGIALPQSVMENHRKASYTSFEPIVTDKGWESYVISAPKVRTNGESNGVLLAVFDPLPLSSRIFSTEYVGRTAEVILVTTQNGELTILHGSEGGTAVVPVHLGTASDNRTAILRQALAGKEGVVETTDYSGIPVLAAFRSMPSIGWAVVVQLDRYEVTAPINRLAMNLLGTGLMLITLLSLSTFFLARRIVGPLEDFATKLDGLEARHWRFKRSIFTGNELETIDCAADELTRRLRGAHDHLEDIVRDRTKELQAQHAQDDAILTNIDYGLLVTDTSGIVQYINRAGELLTGWSSAEARGQSAIELLAMVSKDGSAVRTDEHPVANVLKTKERFNPDNDPEYSLKKRDGSMTALQLRVTPIMRGRQCLGTVAVLRDITEERRIDHMKSDFISLVSHQLRTPLSSMRWYLEMLLSMDAGPLTPDQQEYVEEVATSNARMVHLVNALLNVSRLELGKVQLSPESIDLVKLVTEVGDSFKLELKRRHMTMEVSPKERATMEARSDRALVQLIVENLMSNAIKYGKESTAIIVNIEAQKEDNTVTISVTDTGIGIPEVQQESIGKKLFRGANARLSDADGNGLGLYISHIAAESVGAKLTFKSKESEGTTFLITLPSRGQSEK